MTNKYLEKIAALVRSPANLGTRLSQLSQAGANKLYKITGQHSTHDGLAIGGPAIRNAQTQKVEARINKRLDSLSSQPNMQNPETFEHFARVQGNKPGVIK